MENYSIIELYVASRTPLCLALIFCLMHPSDVFAFDVILLMCELKLRLVDRATPRCLAARGNTFKDLILIGFLALIMCKVKGQQYPGTGAIRTSPALET